MLRSDTGDPNLNMRPVLVVSSTELNAGDTVVAVPFYSSQLEKRRKLPTCVYFSRGEFGLPKDCVAKADDIGPIFRNDLDIARGPIGRLDEAAMARVLAAILHVLDCRDH